MKLLLHVCCAPCAVQSVNSLIREEISPHLYWYGPNIHPYTEYQNRKEALIIFASSRNLPIALQEEYGLRRFIKEAGMDGPERCEACYRMRLFKAAQYARQNQFDAFSTTLLISPYQNHNALKAVGEQAAKEYGIDFLYRDFRPLFRNGQKEAREMGLYLQKYCGCIFSEEERYLKKMEPNERK